MSYRVPSPYPPWPVWLGGFLTAALIVTLIWFYITHTCVRSHRDTCYMTNCSGGKNNSVCWTTPYPCDVCDEWSRDP